MVAHSDDLENGEKDSRCGHRRWELHHACDVGGYLSGGDHPVNRIATRTPSNGSERHGSEDMDRKKVLEGPLSWECPKVLLKTKSSTRKRFFLMS
jgi:hypothetical protein